MVVDFKILSTQSSLSRSETEIKFRVAAHHKGQKIIIQIDKMTNKEKGKNLR